MIKTFCLSFYAKILKIQRVNQKRIESNKNRQNLLKDYWDNVKSEMHRLFLSAKKNKLKAAKFQVKLIQIPDSVRDEFIKKYVLYCKQVFLIKFLHWRIQKLKHAQQEDTMNWA